MCPQLEEVLNSVTTKLGGQPIHGSVLHGTSRRRHDYAVH
jgi:hypothetical protein